MKNEFLNEGNFNAITEGLDSLESVHILRVMGEEFQGESQRREPDAVELITSLYPDYAVGGAKEGKQFEHNGVTYQLQITREWDFGNISGTAELHKLETKLADLKKQTSATNKALKAAKEAVLALHPDWQPTATKVAIKFNRKA